jgi:tetratricopeptide (TPR) repeat protein
VKHRRTPEAIPYLEHAAGLMPDRAELHRELGFAYESTGNYAAAGLALAHALKLGDESADLHLSLGLAALHQGSVEKAEANWKRALELDPRHFRSLYNLGLLRFSQKRLEEAKDLWSRAVTAKPTDPLPHFQLARLAFLQGDRGRAGEEAAQAVRLGLDASQIREDPLLKQLPAISRDETGQSGAGVRD